MTEYNVGDTVHDPTSGEKGVVEERYSECSLHGEFFQSHQELRLWLVDSEEYVWRCSQAVAPVTV